VVGRLRPFPKNQAVEEKKDNRTDNRHDPTRGVTLIPEKELTEKRPKPRTSDTEQNSNDASTRIPARHEEFRDGADNKADQTGDKNTGDTHAAQVMESREGAEVKSLDLAEQLRPLACEFCAIA
jgi:hypothetical protein